MGMTAASPAMVGGGRGLPSKWSSTLGSSRGDQNVVLLSDTSCYFVVRILASGRGSLKSITFRAKTWPENSESQVNDWDVLNKLG